MQGPLLYICQAQGPFTEMSSIPLHKFNYTTTSSVTEPTIYNPIFEKQVLLDAIHSLSIFNPIPNW